MSYIIYKNRDNSFAIQLTSDSSALTAAEMSDISKVELLFKETYYNSEDYPSAFDWSTRASEGVIVFYLGEITDIETGLDTATLIIYNTANPDGIIWDTFGLRVKDISE